MKEGKVVCWQMKYQFPSGNKMYFNTDFIDAFYGVSHIKPVAYWRIKKNQSTLKRNNNGAKENIKKQVL